MILDDAAIDCLFLCSLGLSRRCLAATKARHKQASTDVNSQFNLGRLGMFLEIIEDRLPSHPLHLYRVFRIRIKHSPDPGLAIQILKTGFNFAAVRQRVLESALMRNLVINCLKVKTEAAISGFHPVAQPAARPEIIFSAWAAPVIRREVPLRDMFRRVEHLPDIATRSVCDSFNRDYFAHLQSSRVDASEGVETQRTGFEPAVPVKVQPLSRRPQSTTLAPLHAEL